MGTNRPKVISCIDCGVEVPVKPSGPPPKRCMEHRIKWDKERNARREHGLIKGTQNRAEGFDLGLRTANMRMAIEEALALLNMAFIQPGFADVYIKQAMEALEKGRGEARVDIRDKTDISVISIIEEQTNYQGDQDA